MAKRKLRPFRWTVAISIAWRHHLFRGVMTHNEADTCRRYVTPKLREAGWNDDQILEQPALTAGRVNTLGPRPQRGPVKKADYLLCYQPHVTLAVVEAKASRFRATRGLQQAKQYAEMLGLKFAYATNGHEIVEFDYTTGRESPVECFPSPNELWARWLTWSRLSESAAVHLLEPAKVSPQRPLRYYQEIAVNRVIQAILAGSRRVLVTMATGTGKTNVAFQICWKLWNSRWNRAGEHRRPRILYLADRDVLIDDPLTKDFAPFGDAAIKIENCQAPQSREMYFAIYQAIARDERRPGLYREYSPDFFDLVIVDECHRGSAREDSSWREILEYFAPAYQLGMTATPKHSENVDTYAYFGDPVYQYSLRQGIDDGYLAPYRVHRVITSWDAAGWRPSQGDLDRYGRTIPDGAYQTKDFERVVSLRKRTEIIARHLTDFLRAHGPMAKTIVFCVDQEHADDMRQALVKLNQDLVQRYPDYVCRVVSEEGGVGRGHLSRFQDVETESPVILTTSQMLTTGVDAPTCQNVVLARVINSMVEFKQIIGRGTRLRTDYEKYAFNIIDYTGATRLFSDPDFDGDPVQARDVTLDPQGHEASATVTESTETVEDDTQQPDDDDNGDFPEEAVHAHGQAAGPASGLAISGGPTAGGPRKFYYDGGSVEIVGHLVHELDPHGKQLRTVEYTDYTAQWVRKLCRSAVDLRKRWSQSPRRGEIVAQLADHGIDFDYLAQRAGQPEADPFDLLCHLAFNAPLRTRRQRAEQLRRQRQDFFDQYGPPARQILELLLEKYAQHGPTSFELPGILEVPPLSEQGNVLEIAERFGGPDALREAVEELQALLYAA